MQVELADSTSDEAREAVLGEPVAISCEVPDHEVRYFPQRWGEDEDFVGSALLPDEPSLNVAAEATSCGLSLADPSDPKAFDE